MSKQYDEYLKQHISSVDRGWRWIQEQGLLERVRSVLPDLGDILEVKYQLLKHDKSKHDKEEYEAYDAYFYGDGGIARKKEGLDVDEDVDRAFNYAWLRHIHLNPHHWQYWVLIHDDPEESTEALEMPDRYILEMVLDWWTFSWRSGDLYEIFNWWNEHGDYILLGDLTKEKVVKLLGVILDGVNLVGGEVNEEEWNV